MKMSEADISDVTHAFADPVILSCREVKVKQGHDCSIMIRHKHGRITTVLEYSRAVRLEGKSSYSLTSEAEKVKNKKNLGGKTKKLQFFFPTSSAWGRREGSLQVN